MAALVVEDGTGLPNADSYISTSDADTYHGNRGNAAWAAMAAPAKESALRQATDFMSTLRWSGVRATSTQALDWPRAGTELNGFTIAANVVPEAARRACAELALRASAGSLSPDAEPVVLEETVGPLTTKYAAPSASGAGMFPAVVAMLSGLLASSSRNQVTMVRG